jgi:hypothetical protein
VPYGCQTFTVWVDDHSGEADCVRLIITDRDRIILSLCQVRSAFGAFQRASSLTWCIGVGCCGLSNNSVGGTRF